MSKTYFGPTKQAQDMFESVVTKLVKTVGKDIFLPSPSVSSSENLSLLSLVERKASRWWFGSNKYYTTEFSLANVLQTGRDDFKVEFEAEKDLCAFNKNAILKLDGKLAGHFKAIFDAELENVDSITVKADLGDLHLNEVNQQALLDSVKGRLLNMNHEVVRELSSKKRRALCVVVGTLKTTVETKIYATLNFKLDSDAKADIPVSNVAGGEIKGDIEEDKSRTLTLPAGTVLAYQVLELAVNSKGQMRVMVFRDNPGGFNCEDIDVVDARPPTVSCVTRSTLRDMFNALQSLPDETRRSLGSHMMSLCKDLARLNELARDFKTNSLSNSASQDVTSVYNLVMQQKASDVKKAAEELCSALRGFDEEALLRIASFSQRDLQLLCDVLDATTSGQALPINTPLLTRLLERGGNMLLFLIDDLCYDLSFDGLNPSASCTRMMNLAYVSLYGLNVCVLS